MTNRSLVLRVLQHVFVVVAWVILAACGAENAAKAPPAHASGYEGRCALVGIDQVPAVVDQQGDAVALVARYRVGDTSAEPESVFGLRFLVARDRERDLRLHLQAHSEVVCESDSAAAPTRLERVEVPPFEGQPGEPLR